VGLTAATLLLWLLLQGAALVLGPAPAPGPPLATLEGPVDHNHLVAELREWSIEEGHELLGGCETGLIGARLSGFGSQELGTLTVFQLRRPSLLARWRILPGWLHRSGPELLVLCVTNHATRRTWVRILPVGSQAPSAGDVNEITALALAEQLRVRTGVRSVTVGG
jgi:hypothetical protein